MDYLETVLEEQGPVNDICEACGENNFYLEGGFYYCSLCATQSQTVRLYVDDALNSNFDSQRAQVGAAILREKKKKKKKATEDKPFISSWEVWNLILKHFADKLVEIGFPDSVRTKIFHLYVTFMKQRKVIFVSTSNPHAKPRMTIGEPKMNLYSLCGVKPNLKRLKSLKKRLKKKTSRKTAKQETSYNSKQHEKLHQSIQRKKAIEKEYLTEASNLAKTDDDFNVVFSASEKPKEVKPQYQHLAWTKATRVLKSTLLKHTQLNPLIRRRYKSNGKFIVERGILSFERFTLKTALILVFVALRELGFPVVFSDVVRLYHVGILDFDCRKLARKAFGENLNKFNSNFVSFAVNNFKLYNIPFYAPLIQNFVDYVGIKKFCIPQVKEIIPKYIDEFVLPREFECLINLLNHMFSFDDYSRDMVYKHFGKYRVLPEMLLLPQIIVILKMLFGLDDRTEKFQSKFAKLVNQIMKEEATKRNLEMEEWTELFVIEDWFSYLQRRRDLVQTELFSSTVYTSGKNPTITQLENMMRTCSTESEGVNEDNQDDESNLKSFNEKKKMTAACLSLLENILKEKTADNPPVPNVQPYIPLPLPTQSIVDQYLQRHPRVHDPSYKSTLPNFDFVQKRIDFIWNPKKYANLLTNRGYKVKIIHGDAINQCPLKFGKNDKESKVIAIFQPYKNFDDFVGKVRQECSSSIKLLLQLCEDIVTTKPSEKNMDTSSTIFQQFVNEIAGIYVKRCQGGLIPTLTKMDYEDESEDSE